jgi:ubiquitin-protein ligase
MEEEQIAPDYRLRAIISAPDFITNLSYTSTKPEICLNADSAPGTALHTAFVNACRRYSDRNVEIVFHGTKDANINAILRNGLDPSLRGSAHGQALGPGEYFTRSVDCALGYSLRGRYDSKYGSNHVSGAVIVFAVLATRQDDHGGTIVVSESDCQIPLALLTYGEWTPFLELEATRLRALAQVAIQEAEKAEAESNAAIEEAIQAVLRANVCQHLGRGELTEAIALYDTVTHENGGQPPDWSPELLPYLAHYSISERDAWFPGSSSKVMDTGPTARPATMDINGRTVEEMQKFAHAKCDEASWLRSEADLRDAEACDAEAKASFFSSASAQVSPGPPQMPAQSLLSHVPPPRLAASTPSVLASASFPTQQPTAGATRRILQELRRLKTNCDEMLDVALVDESDIYTWRIDLGFDQSTELGRELHLLAAQTAEPTGAVQLEVTFNGGYPGTPPFIRVVSPRFQFHTGHVTVGGSICLQELTTSGWSPEMTVHGIMHLIRTALVQGGGRLDPICAQVPYAAAEAREAFARVARAHGWQ